MRIIIIIILTGFVAFLTALFLTLPPVKYSCKTVETVGFGDIKIEKQTILNYEGPMSGFRFCVPMKVSARQFAGEQYAITNSK